MRYLLLYILAIIFSLSSCQSNKKEYVSYRAKFYNSGRFLVKETYDSSGKIVTKQYFNKDTMPDGAYIEYFSDGIIGKWVWFIANDKNPSCGFYYYSDGSFDTLKGNPFISAFYNTKGEGCFKILAPPDLCYIIKFIDFYNDNKLAQYDYEPIKIDSVNWVILRKFEFEKGHKYKLFFCTVDTSTKLLINRSSFELKKAL